MSRHSCTHCGCKLTSHKIQLVYYPLLNRNAYHCLSCLSSTKDYLQIVRPLKERNFIELFSGSGTVSSIAQGYNYKPWTVDIEPKYSPWLCSDVLKVNLKSFPRSVDFIWASLPCTTYSVLSLSHHWNRINHSFRKYYYFPKSPEAIRAIQILEKTLYLIRALNPRVFVIENPRGALRHMPQMHSIPFLHTVSYSDYGFDYYKPTDLFTNYPGLKLSRLRSSVGQSFTGSVINLPNAYYRSVVPPGLIHSILSQTSI